MLSQAAWAAPSDAGGELPVTVIIPSKRGRECVDDAIGSVLAQEGVGNEIIVVLDDCTAARADWIEQQYRDHPSVRFVRHAARSASASRNLGLRSARHAWVAFLDDDDIMRAGRLQQMLSAAVAQRARWVVSDAERFDVTTGRSRRQHASGVDLRHLLVSNVVPGGGSGVVAQRQLVLDVGGFDERLRNSEDWDLWIRLATIGPPASVRNVTLVRRVSSAGKGGAVFGSLQAFGWIVWKYRSLRRQSGVRVDILAYVRWIFRRQRARLCAWSAERVDKTYPCFLTDKRTTKRHR